VAKTFHDGRGPRAVVRDCSKLPQVVDGRRVPSCRDLYRMLENNEARATDGCKVAITGECAHGKPSWLKELEVI
jgi:hypothetical protein